MSTLTWKCGGPAGRGAAGQAAVGSLGLRPSLTLGSARSGFADGEGQRWDRRPSCSSDLSCGPRVRVVAGLPAPPPSRDPGTSEPFSVGRRRTPPPPPLH